MSDQEELLADVLADEVPVHDPRVQRMCAEFPEFESRLWEAMEERAALEALAPSGTTRHALELGSEPQKGMAHAQADRSEPHREHSPQEGGQSSPGPLLAGFRPALIAAAIIILGGLSWWALARPEAEAEVNAPPAAEFLGSTRIQWGHAIHGQQPAVTLRADLLPGEKITVRWSRAGSEARVFAVTGTRWSIPTDLELFPSDTLEATIEAQGRRVASTGITQWSVIGNAE